MAFTILPYSAVNAGAATYADMSAAVDADFSQRSNHYIFTEQYQLLADATIGATATRARYSVPTWNAVAEQQLWPMMQAAAIVPSNPQIERYTPNNPILPVNEEVQVQVTCTGAETDYSFLWIGTPDWNRNVPQGKMDFVTRATGAVAKTLNSWSGPGALTFAASLRGGVYAVIGAECFCANTLAFRLVFPRTRQYHGRKMRPGSLCMNALADVPLLPDTLGKYEWGVWGYFHTFELPQIEVYGNVAGAATQEVRLWLVYLGESVSLLDQMVMSGG